MGLEEFVGEIRIASPGRINLLGEHIDYNGGHVLPGAINFQISLVFSKNATSICTISSKGYPSVLRIDLAHIEPSTTEWENYILGVVYHLNRLKPHGIEGFDCFITSNLPVGSGISSSAALECGMAKGLDELFCLGLTDEEIIDIAVKAEHSFVGTQCGIMDQFAVVKGKKGHVISLNCQNREYELIRAELAPYAILLLNSNVSHNLATSEYNTRRRECEAALNIIQSKYREYEYLVDVPEQILEEFKMIFQGNQYHRALYVTQENQRVLNAIKALKSKKLDVFGKYLYESHEGLSQLYNVSCKELDFMVNYSKSFDSILGSRMMGGGFGGCTINLIHADGMEEYVDKISRAYWNEFGIELTPIIVELSNGVIEI